MDIFEEPKVLGGTALLGLLVFLLALWPVRALTMLAPHAPKS